MSSPEAPSAPARVPPVVVKLGGSILTRKRRVEALRPKVLARLAREVAAAADRPIVVLHGAGSFGHPGAARFGLARGPERGTADDRRRGAAIVSAEVRRLHLAVLRALVDAGANPWSVPIATHATNRDGRPDAIDSAPFAAALDAGHLPVSFGDVVPDLTWGFSILSADDIAVALVRDLRSERVVFVSDVPGIYRPGAGNRRTVIEALDDGVLESLRVPPGGRDVTGGIRGKAEAMRAIAAQGADAGLISGLTDGLLSRAIRGERVYGSWWHGRPSGR